MAELASTEKIQPCLLDRLTDLAPERGQEALHERVMSMTRYREGVLRDLRWLLSTSRHNDEEDLQFYPALRTSTLNYGIRSLCGRLAESLSRQALEQEISQAVEAFEPRIMPGSLSIEIKDSSRTKAKNEMVIEIRGELWARPIPEEFTLRTEIDLETGEIKPV